MTDGRHPARRDERPTERRPAELRREIGYAIQQIGLFPHLTVGRQHRHGPAAARLGQGAHPDARRRAARAREPRPAETCATAIPAQLSGGQRQRVGVARALAADPPLMLMDEPFGAIDPINRERLQNEFLRLQAEIRKTIVFVTHDIDEAIKMGDRIAVMQKGGKLAQYAAARRAADVRRRASSSRTSSAPTGRSSAWRSSACATSTSGRRRSCGSGSRWPSARAKLADSDLPYPLLVDDEGRPARLAVGARRSRGEQRPGATCARRRARARAGRRAARRALRPARSHEAQYGTGGRRQGTVAGRPVGGDHLPRPQLAPTPGIKYRAAPNAWSLMRLVVRSRPGRAGRDPATAPSADLSCAATTASARAGSSTTSAATRTRSCSTCYLTLVSAGVRLR